MTIHSRKFKIALGLELELGLKLGLGLGLGFEFDFEFPKFSTLNCHDFQFPTLNGRRTVYR